MKRVKGIGFGKLYFKPQLEIVTSTEEVKTNKERDDLLNVVLNEKLDLHKF